MLGDIYRILRTGIYQIQPIQTDYFYIVKNIYIHKELACIQESTIFQTVVYLILCQILARSIMRLFNGLIEIRKFEENTLSSVRSGLHKWFLVDSADEMISAKDKIIDCGGPL